MTSGAAPRADAPGPPAHGGGLRRLLPGRRTLRLRLTLWYVAVLALSTGVIAVLFYVGLETALMDQLDSGIRETAVTEAKTSVGDFLPAGGEPAPEDAASESMIRVLAAGGEILGGAGAFRLPDAGKARRGLRELLGLPLMLVLAAAGGLFLAGRALAPIDHMATAAERITGSDLSGRMGPQGSEELGRLAAAFDRMLERLEQAFRRERRFVSDVSHELRTPLTSIKGTIEATLGARAVAVNDLSGARSFSGNGRSQSV